MGSCREAPTTPIPAADTCTWKTAPQISPQRLFVVNADAGLVDVLDIADPTNPELIDTIVAAGSLNSVDVHDGAVAVASQADPAQDPGFVELFDAQGMYLPDGIDAYESSGATFIVAANEGDARDCECFSEETRIGDLTLDRDVFRFPGLLQRDDRLGRLRTTTAFPTVEPATELYCFGARSFSIRDEAGNLVYDSGNDFEQITAAADPENFNSTNDENGSFDSRSDDKGPEPEGVEIGRAFGSTYAFIGLERVGGIMVYNIDSPSEAQFVDYVNNRDFDGDAEAGTAGDLGPEGITIISAADSPIRFPLLAVANEVSGTTTIYKVLPRTRSETAVRIDRVLPRGLVAIPRDSSRRGPFRL